MKFKSLAKVLLSCVLAGALLTGCGETKMADKPANNFSGKEVQLGMLSPLNMEEGAMGDVIDKIEDATQPREVKHLPKFFDNLNAMQMAVESGQVSEISLYGSVATHLAERNDKFEVVPYPSLNKISYSFCFAVRAEDKQLKADLDKIVEEMKADGSLDKLIDKYITNVSKGQDPPAVEIPTIDGAETIKIGITGDLPPLDLILPDGNAAGFNTAMLAEVAKRLNKNVKLVHVTSGARAAALTSKVIDVVFWAVVPFGNDMIPANIDKPDGLELSTPYFRDNVALLKLKDSK